MSGLDRDRTADGDWPPRRPGLFDRDDLTFERVTLDTSGDVEYEEPGIRLNLGCGALVIDGWVNVDNYEGPGIDLVHDLDDQPWPWADGSVEEIVALDIYEHVDNPLGFVNEMWRVSRPGTLIRLRTTKWDTRQSFTDPTHKRWLTEDSFNYWIPGTEFHARYGAGYSGGRHFALLNVYQDGQELEWRLLRLGSRCEGACDGSDA